MSSAKPPSPRVGPLVDTHAHLDDTRLLDQIRAVLTRAAEAGVEQILAIGTTADSSDEVVRIAANQPGVSAVVGIQPNHGAEAQPGDLDRIAALVERQARHIVAIGETGLDRYWDHTPFPLQQELFDQHLALAHEHDLPVVIHCRNCERDIVEQLERQGRPISGVLHSFTGNWDDAQAFLGLGLHLSFAGMITFSNKDLDALRDAAARAPIDRILVETDSPYLSPHPYRGKTNEPARVAWTLEAVARARGADPLEIACATTENARRLFRLHDRSRLPLAATTG